MRVTAVVQAPSIVSESATVTTPRSFDAVDEFAAALGKALGENVSIIEGSLADAPKDGYVLVFSESGLLAHPSLWPRVILVNADRATVRTNVERFDLVSAIEKHRYFCWRTQREDEEGSGVIGLKTVAERIGATVMNGPYTSARYGWLSSAAADDLPSLLAAYLKGHEAETAGSQQSKS